MPPPLLDVVRDSEVIVQAKASECGEGWARYVVFKVYRGEIPVDGNMPVVIRVSPVLIPGQRPLTTLPRLWMTRSDEEAVLFLKKGEMQGEFTPVSFGQWRIRPESRNEDLQAIEHLLETWSLPDEARQMEIMVRDLKSGDLRLKWPAHEFIGYTAARSRNALAYKDHFLSLLTSENPEWRSLGLGTVQELKIEEAIPCLIKLTRDPDPEIVCRASLALRHYGTPEVMEILMSLMEHPNPRVRIRAIIDTGKFSQNEVILGLVRLSDDPDPEVRAMVPTGFASRPDAVRKAVLWPILMHMIQDTDSRVRASAFRAFGHDRERVPLDMLWQRLTQETPSSDELAAILESLHIGLVAIPREQAKAIIREHEDCLIGVAMREERDMIGFHALSILEMNPSSKALRIMEEAANKHRLKYVRDHARYLLKKNADVLKPSEEQGQ